MMIKNHSITPAAVARLLVSIAAVFVNFISAILVFILIAFVILPMVGLPLTGLLWLFASRFGVPQAMALDAVNLMSGGALRAVPMVTVVTAASFATLAWRQVIESRISYVSLSTITACSAVCIAALFYFTFLYAPAFGLASGFALAVATTPWLLSQALLSIFVANANDSVIGVLGSLAAGLVLTYAFYSAIAVSLLQFVCISMVPISRGALRAQLQIGREERQDFRFRIWPSYRTVLRILLDVLGATISAITAGVFVFLVYRGVYSAIAGSERLASSMIDAVVRLGIVSDLAWPVAYYTAASVTLLVVALAGCVLRPSWFGCWITRGQLLEWVLISALAGIAFFSLAIAATPRGQWIVWFYLGVPITLIFLFARSAYWRSLLRCRDRLLSGQQKSVEEVIREGSVGPILYLRAFMDDALTVGKAVRLLDLLMGVPVRSRRFEEIVASRGFLWRPIVAIRISRSTCMACSKNRRLIPAGKVKLPTGTKRAPMCS